jgi:hypothetical protein
LITSDARALRRVSAWPHSPFAGFDRGHAQEALSREADIGSRNEDASDLDKELQLGSDPIGPGKALGHPAAIRPLGATGKVPVRPERMDAIRNMKTMAGSPDADLASRAASCHLAHGFCVLRRPSFVNP